MSVSLLLEMAVSADPDRVAVVDGNVRLTTAQLSELSDGGARVIDQAGVRSVVYLGVGGAMLPLLTFASARAGRPLTPLNYRLSEQTLAELIARVPDPLIVADQEYLSLLATADHNVVTSHDFLTACRSAEPMHGVADGEDVSIVLFTSGTTSRPKAVELTHGNLMAYVTGTVELPEGTEMIMPGDNTKVTVELITPIAMDEGLRFAIREGGRTVGAGVVSKIIE